MCKNNLKALLKGLLHGVVLMLILSLLLSLIFILTPFSTALLSSFSTIILLLSVFYGALTAVRQLEHRGLFYGLVFGMIFFVFLILLNITGLESIMTQSFLLKLVYSLIAGALGGIVGVSLKK